jgi:hypothetical protein
VVLQVAEPGADFPWAVALAALAAKLVRGREHFDGHAGVPVAWRSDHDRRGVSGAADVAIRGEELDPVSDGSRGPGEFARLERDNAAPSAAWAIPIGRPTRRSRSSASAAISFAAARSALRSDASQSEYRCMQERAGSVRFGRSARRWRTGVAQFLGFPPAGGADEGEHLSQGRGSRRATILIACYGLAAPGPTGVSVCCCMRPSLGLSSPRHGAGSVPWYSMVTGKPATVLFLAGGCAAGLAAGGAIG